MKRNVIVGLLALATSVVAFGATPVIESIDPIRGPVAGGTVVTLRGKNFASSGVPCVFAICPKPAVTIGGKRTEVLRVAEDGTWIEVKTPPSAGGTYDVSFSRPVNGGIFPTQGGYFPIVEGSVTWNDAFTYGDGGYERVLVPIYSASETPGAFGSRWVTELIGWNPTPFAIPVYQVPPATPPFPFPSGTPEWGQGESSFRPVLTGPGNAFLYVFGQEGDSSLAFHLRVRDVSRQSESWGTEVPVVSEKKAFVGKPILLNDIPNGGDTRAMLRVYDFDGPTGGSVDVEIHLDDGRPGEQFLGDRIDFPTGPYQEFPTAPGFIQVDLTSELASIPLARNASRLRVSVHSRTSDKRLWAFVSVTNNRTQQITTITPQH